MIIWGGGLNGILNVTRSMMASAGNATLSLIEGIEVLGLEKV